MPTEQTALSPAERDDYLAFAHAAPMARQAMSLSMLMGLSVAQSIGPCRLPDERLLPWVWDSQQGLRPPQFSSPAQREALTALVLRQLHAGQWDENSPSAALAHGAGSGAPLDAIAFCQGFTVAVNLAFEHWAPLLGSHPQWLLAVMTLGQPDTAALAQLSASALKALVEGLGPDLAQLRAHWLAHPASAQTAWSGDAIWQHLRAKLLHFSKPFPHDAMLLAHAQRHRVAPGLVQALAAIAQDPADALDGEWMLQHFALALLANWRDTRAYRPMLALARLDADSVDGLLGDMLHELYGRALASVCDGDLQPLIDTVDDPGVGPWVKMALLDAWKLRVIEGDAPLAPFEQYLLAQGLAGAERLRRGETCAAGAAEMLDTVASLAGDVGSPLLLGPVRGWYTEGLLDPQHMDQPFFEAEMALPWAERVALVRERHHSYVEDASDEIAWWASYAEDDEPDVPPAPSTIVRDGPKVGRNDPCPCGSGVKFKKCHGAN